MITSLFIYLAGVLIFYVGLVIFDYEITIGGLILPWIWPLVCIHFILSKQ